MQKKQDHRRKSNRYPARWKVAVVFDKSDGKPILHTHTVDMSSGGAAIISDHDNLTGTVVTVLLAQPNTGGKEPPKMLKARARIVSSVEVPPGKGYRHGLSFVAPPGESAESLEQLLAATHDAVEAAVAASSAAAATPTAPAAPAAPAGGGRLARLRELAQAKLAEPEKVDPQQEINERLTAAMQRAHTYLKELAEQLDIVKPAFPKGYTIVGVPEFTGLTWKSGRADFRTREVDKDTRVWEQVTLNYRISADKQLSISRESPASDRVQRALTDFKIEFKTREARDERGFVRNTTFLLPCEVSALVMFEGNFSDGSIRLRLRNVERFGSVEHKIVPEAITEASMEEFAGYILGETHKVGPLLQGA